jgi:hypothetical protein
LIALISTSGPLVSAALFTPEGRLAESASQEAPRAASGAALTMLEPWLHRLSGLAADAGPGSFTGVKVAATITQTLAWARGLRAGRISTFDLIAPQGDAAVMIRRGVWIARIGGRVQQLDERPDGVPEGPPLAARAGEAWTAIQWMEPAAITPDYRLEPSVSQAKRALIMGAGEA